MSRWLDRVRRRPLRALGQAAALALAPKCALCLLAYAGLGAAAGIPGRRFCGGDPGPSGAWAAVPALAAAALFAASFLPVRPGSAAAGKPARGLGR